MESLRLTVGAEAVVLWRQLDSGQRVVVLVDPPNMAAPGEPWGSPAMPTVSGTAQSDPLSRRLPTKFTLALAKPAVSVSVVALDPPSFLTLVWIEEPQPDTAHVVAEAKPLLAAIAEAEYLRLELEASQGQLSAVLAGLSQAAVLVDDISGRARLNDRAIHLLGLDGTSVATHVATSALGYLRAQAVNSSEIERDARAAMVQPGAPGIEQMWHFASAPTHLRVRSAPIPEVLTGRLWMAEDVSAAESLLEQERALFDYRERFQRAVHTSAVGIAIVSREGRFEEVNESLCASVGLAAQQLLGRDWSAVVHPEDAPRLAEHTDGVLKGQGVPANVLVRLLRQDDTSAMASLTLTPILGADGEIVSLLAHFVDVTERELAREEASQRSSELQATLDAMQDPLIVIHPVRATSGEIVDWECRDANRQACLSINVDRDEFVGTRMFSWYPWLSGGDLAGLLEQVARTGEPLVREGFVARFTSDGPQRRFDLRVRPINPGLLVSWRDVTESYESARALADSEQRFRLLAENTSDVILVIRAQVIDWVSPSVRSTLGWSPAELLGSGVAKLLHPQDEPVVEQIRLAAERGEHVRVRCRWRDSGGSFRWLDVSAGPSLDAEGNVDGVVVAARVVDDEMAAQAALELLAQERTRLIGQLPVGVFRADIAEGASASLTFASERARDIFELDRTQDVAQLPPLVSLVHPKDRQSLSDALQQMTATADVMSWQGRVSSARGENWVRIQGVFDDRGGGVLEGIVEDVSDAKEHERVLVAARTAAENAAAVKAEFLANMSHEIRTPLTAVMGLLHLLDDTDLQPLQQGYANRARTAARSLLAIIDDSLDYSKIDAGSFVLHPEPVQTEGVLAELGAVLAANAAGKPVEVLYDIDSAMPAEVVTDGLRLRQVLLNLASNAIKFTESGEVVLGARVVARGPGDVTVEFSVRDTGIGMTRESLEHVFEGFVQAEGSIARRFGGTGLGLTISRRLVELMGGELVAQSELGVGTRFSFTVSLPVSQTGADEPVSESPPLACRYCTNGPAWRCLVVAEASTARDILVSICRGWGWEAESCDPDPAEVVAACEGAQRGDQPFDVLLVNVHDRQSPPLSALAAAWGSASVGDAPTIVVVSPQHLVREVAAVPRVARVLTKPFTATDVAEAVCDLLLDCPNQSARSGSTGGGRLSGIHVLLAEDNDINRQVVMEVLEREGARISTALDGREAVVATVSQPDIDVVLMDMQMPHVDGLAATRAIRAQRTSGSLPILALTANARPEDWEACLEAGMDDYISKPFHLDDLVARLRYWSGRDQVAAAPPTLRPPADRTDERSRGPSYALLDAESALSRVNGARVQYAAILERMAQRIPQTIAEINEALAAGDRLSAARVAHGLKGSALTIGADQLAQAAARIEAVVRDGSEFGVVEDLLGPGAALGQAAGETLAAIREWLDHPAG